MTLIQPRWPAPASIKAFTTTRLAWGDKSSRLPEERQRLVDTFHLPAEPIFLTQTHSDIALEAKPENRDQTGDGSYTHTPLNICVAMTADCLPVLACHQSGRAVAACHAGWRGLASGIIENTLLGLNEPMNELYVWLGPAIGSQQFEVGNDVVQAFVQKNPDAIQCFQSTRPDKWLADIYALARQRLIALGVSPEAIFGGEHCTKTEEALFFSYRREKENAGRMASLIWIQPN